jgi:hypothetical protein
MDNVRTEPGSPNDKSAETEEARDIADSLSVAPVRAPIRVTGPEKFALGLAALMMLAPLAMAAWGAHQIS